MGLLSLFLRDFRCFAAVDAQFSADTNLIVGENASGKTSLLEAIFLLGRGRSFHTAHLEAAIRAGAQGFKLAGEITTGSGSLSIGLTHENGSLQAQLGSTPAEKLAQLVESFPVQLVDSQAHLLVNGGPRYRRQFLDWGVFHVEPDFFPAWQRYRRILRQRNALLRSGKSTRELTSWDRELISSGEILDRSRRDYLAVFASQAARWARQALGEMEVGLEYRPGWPDDLSLQEALKGSADRDRQTGTTQVGPHRADILIKVAEKAAQARVSRGQEKVLAGALLLAQAALYRSIRGRACTLLLDDLAAELDAAHLARFLDMVDETSAQVFLTAIEPSPLITTKADRVFHVKQGEISRMV